MVCYIVKLYDERGIRIDKDDKDSLDEAMESIKNHLVDDYIVKRIGSCDEGGIIEFLGANLKEATILIL